VRMEGNWEGGEGWGRDGGEGMREGDERVDGWKGWGWGWMRTDTQRNIYFSPQCMRVLLGRT